MKLIEQKKFRILYNNMFTEKQLDLIIRYIKKGSKDFSRNDYDLLKRIKFKLSRNIGHYNKSLNLYKLLFMKL